MSASLCFIFILQIASIHTADYTCSTEQDCNVIFNTYQSAYQSTVTCPPNHACHITCTDPTPSSSSDSYQTCQETTIIASSSSKLTITCNGLGNCQNINLIGSSDNTTIHCDGTNSCQLASFDFSTSPYASIHCNSNGSCNSVAFDATYTQEMTLYLNTIHSGDDIDIYCGSICSISSKNTQNNIIIHSEDTLYGDIFECDTNNDCFTDSTIHCGTNYTISCDITYTDNTYSCDTCLNVLFTDFVTEINMDYTTSQSDTNLYRQRVQQTLYSTIIQLLTDPTDQFRNPIQTNCDCIDDIQQHVAILITDQFIPTRRRLLPTYSMRIRITTDLEVINAQMQSLLSDERFKSLFINLAQYDDTFDILSVNIPQTEPDEANAEVIWWITGVVLGILGIVLIVAVIGTIQMYKYDVTIYVTGVLWFGLYTADFYSDILFSYEVVVTYINTDDLLFGILVIGCWVFLVLPIVTSIASLFHFQDKWKKDPSIGDHVTGWNRDWSTYLLCLTILSGSSFAAVNILNSRVFGHPLFCMGLSYRHLKKFENQRLWGVILSENIPQMIIQGIFVWRTRIILSDILLLAFGSSLLMIIFALVDIYNNKRLFGTASTEDYQTVLKVPVISHEVGLKQWKLCLATHRFNEVFSKIIGVDKYAIEVDLPSPHPNGLVINFSVRTVDISPRQILDEMMRAQRNGAMAKFIAEAWDLQDDPILGSIKVNQVGKKSIDLSSNTPIEAVNPLNSDAKTLEEQSAVNAIVINPNRWDDDEERERTDTFKPYALDKVTKTKIAMQKNRSKSETDTVHPHPAIPESEEINESQQTDTNTNITIPKRPTKTDKETNNADDVGDSDIPRNITSTQIQLKQTSQSELPRQRTGTHTRKMIEMLGQSSKDLVAKGKVSTQTSTSPISSIGQQNKAILAHMNNQNRSNQYTNQQSDPAVQFRQHVQNYGGAPSVPNLYGATHHQKQYKPLPPQPVTDRKKQFQQHMQMQQQRQGYAASAFNLHRNNPHDNNNIETERDDIGDRQFVPNQYGRTHTHTRTQPTLNTNTYQQNNDPATQFRQHVQNYGGAPSVPNLYARKHDTANTDTYQHQYKPVPQPPPDMTAQFQQHVQQMQQQGQGYAASAFNLHRNNNNNIQQHNYNRNMQQQFQQNPQIYSASTSNMNGLKETDHESFVPPAPHQEVDKYVEWQTKRQLLNEEKKARQRKEREQRRLEKPPQLNKIESMNEMDMNRQQWSQMNEKVNPQESNEKKVRFSNKLEQHELQESNHMDDILNQMNESRNQF